MVSDGTLRLLALTLPAYLGDFKGIYLIEEPENGIHPRAVETMFQSLSSVYEEQILMATHSPVILSIAHPATVLCFAKSDDEATDIVRGSEHPSLQDWRGETNLLHPLRRGRSGLNTGVPMNDLVVLTPDKNMEAAIGGILTRHRSLAIRPLNSRILVHPARDPGCLKDGFNLLRPFSKQYSHGLVLMDHDGCGRETDSREQLEAEVEGQLRSSGWDDRAAAIVVDPELEIWVWSELTSPSERVGMGGRSAVSDEVAHRSSLPVGG